MTLYHNADINDLEAICRDGLVSLDVSKNDKWEEGHRADNRTDRFGIGTSVYSAATAEELASLVKMGKIFLASSYCYFRGLSESGEIIDFYNVKYF